MYLNEPEISGSGEMLNYLTTAAFNSLLPAFVSTLNEYFGTPDSRIYLELQSFADSMNYTNLKKEGNFSFSTLRVNFTPLLPITARTTIFPGDYIILNRSILARELVADSIELMIQPTRICYEHVTVEASSLELFVLV